MKQLLHRSLSVVFLALIFVFSLISAPAQAETFEIACGDTIELIAAINTANENEDPDIINLAPGCVYTFTVWADSDGTNGFTALPRITTPIVINGSGAIIERDADAAMEFRLLNVTESGELLLQDVTVRGGAVSDYPAGAILNRGNLTVSQSTISDNRSHSGGGILNTGTLTVTGSTISGNSVYLIGGGILSNTGTVEVINSSVSGNSAGANGGGMYVANTTLTVTGSAISGNSTSNVNGAGSGGGIFVSLGTTTVTSSVVSGNSAVELGGGILANSGTMTVTSTVISGNASAYGAGLTNQSATVNVRNSTISGNSAAIGGGLGNVTSPLNVTNSIVWGNRASYMDNSIFTNGSSMTVTYSIVEGGYAGTENSDDDPLFVDSEPAASAPTTAGDYHIRLGSPAINAGSNDDVPDDLLYDIDGDDRIIGGIVDIGADENGTCTAYAFPYTVAAGNTTDFVNAIHCANANADESVITLTAGTYSFTSAADVDVSWGDSALPRITTPVVINGNGATIERAAGSPHFRPLRAVSGGALTLNDVTVTGGAVLDEGGGILSLGAPLTVNNSTISGNMADGGGGIASLAATVTVTNSTINGNMATYGGGGLLPYLSTVTVTNSTISGNSAGTNGGGIYANSGTMTVTSSVISGNSATSGGGIILWAGALTVTNSTISGNSATSGGGIYGATGALTVTNSIIWGNSSQVNGIIGTATVSDSIIQDGFAGDNVITADPLFVAPVSYTSAPTTAGDYRLQAASPAINAGSTAALPLDEYDLDGDGDTSEPLPIDLDGNPRVRSTIVDMGAYEHTVDAGVEYDKLSVSVAEGGATDSVAAVLLARPGAPVTLTIATGGQVTVSPTELVFTQENWATPQSITVMAVDDTDIEGPHSDVLQITSSSTHADYNNISVTITVNITDGELSVQELLQNGGFENKVSGSNLPEAWQVKAPKSIKVLCKPDKANSGNCALKFRHGRPVRGVVTQDIDLTGLTLQADDQLVLSVYVRDGNIPARVKAVLRVVYEDGSKDKVKKGLTSDVGYELSTLPPLTLQATPVAVRVRFTHKTPNAALTIDDASLLLVPSVGRRGGGSDLILPPPALPDGFRGTN